METVEEQTCRLCFSTENHQIDIFSKTKSSENIAAIITEHIGEVSDSDALPKTVCVNCWNTTENFHKFHRDVKTAQADYLQKFIKSELCVDFCAGEGFDGENDAIKPSNFVEVIQNEIRLDFNEFDDEILTNIKCDELADDSGNFGLCSEPDSEIDAAEWRNRVKTTEENQTNEILSENFDFSCDVCQTDLKSLKRAITHYKREHGIQEGYIKCCDMKFSQQKQVEEHIEWHHDPDLFRCKYCMKILKTKTQLQRHHNDHKYMSTFICDFCGKITSRKAEIKRHLLRHVNLIELMQCKLCPKRFPSKTRLETHIRFYHSADAQACVKKQMDELKEMNLTTLNATEIEQVMFKHFDMSCDVCGDGLKSLQQAQFHYMHEHQEPNGYIKCCGIQFKKNAHMIGHILWHTDPNIFRCNVCSHVKKTIPTLRQHLMLHLTPRKAPKNSEYECTECGRAFNLKQGLARHMRNIHGISASSADNKGSQTATNEMNCFDMTCDVCNITLASLQHAKLHYMDEHSIADGYIKCCGVKFKEVKHINDHLKYHRDPNIYKCDRCEKTFSRKDRFNGHLSTHKVLETRRHTCTICDKSFISRSFLNKHAKKHQKLEKLFPCNLCNRRFATEKQQKSHEERIHNKDVQAAAEICEFCAKTFSSRDFLRAHLYSVHLKSTQPQPDRSVQCEVCNVRLSNRYILKTHMHRHTSEPQKCPQCDKISPNLNALECHIRNVHTERIHKCHLCDKSFKAAVALKDHVATHTGEKLYKCLYCPESFIWRPNCYSHQKKAHPHEWNQSQTKKKTVTKV